MRGPFGAEYGNYGRTDEVKLKDDSKSNAGLKKFGCILNFRASGDRQARFHQTVRTRIAVQVLVDRTGLAGSGRIPAMAEASAAN